MMGKNKQQRRHAEILTRTATFLSLGKARARTGGPSAFPPAKQGKSKILGGDFICVSHNFLTFFICFSAVMKTILLDKSPIR